METNEFQLLSDKIDALKSRIDELLKRPTNGKYISKSDKLDELTIALSKAQAEYKPIVNLRDNAYSDIAYASLQDVIDATRPALTKNNLAVTQVLFDYAEDACQILHTQLLHSSGQFIDSQMIVKPNGNDPIAITSYINWLKRIAYSALVGCAIPKEDDDAVRHAKQEAKPILRGSAAKRKDESYDRVNKQQYDELVLELDGFPDLAQMLMDEQEIDDLHDLPQSKWRSALNKIRENKLIYKGR